MTTFNLEEALAGAPVITRNGQPVTGLYIGDGNDTNYRLHADYLSDGTVAHWLVNGRFLTELVDHRLDLFMVDTTTTP